MSRSFSADSSKLSGIHIYTRVMRASASVNIHTLPKKKRAPKLAPAFLSEILLPKFADHHHPHPLMFLPPPPSFSVFHPSAILWWMLVCPIQHYFEVWSFFTPHQARSGFARISVFTLSSPESRFCPGLRLHPLSSKWWTPVSLCPPSRVGWWKLDAGWKMGEPSQALLPLASPAMVSAPNSFFLSSLLSSSSPPVPLG